MTILLRVALVVLVLSSCLAHAAVPRPRLAGVHFPMNITPSVSISDGQWLFDLYVILLNRQADETGYRVNFGDLQNGVSRVAIYGAFVASQEFQSNTALWDAGGFVSRAYNTLLHRAAQPNEINNWVSQMTAYNGQGGQGSVTWPQLLNDVYGSQEYHNDCPTQYYTLGAPVTEGEPLLRDLFSGAFRLQIANESQVLTLNLPSAKAVWDQKLLTLPNPMAAVDGYPYMAFTRVYLNPDFTIALMSSLDGVTFNEVDSIFDLQAGQTFYDPHVSVDYSVCPPRYVMSMECIGHGGAASLCTSFTSTPSRAFTWTNPFIVVDGCTGGSPAACGTIAAESASTGVTLHDGYSKYLAWTQVYDGVGPSDPQVHTYSQMAGPVASTTNTYYGTVMGGSTPVLTMMPSVPQPWCTTSWDCNNRDKQDWKREGDMYYVAYNGANYYRCNGKWGISFVRSSTAVGSVYTDYLPISQGISAVLDTTCGASYPTVNVIKGEIRVHYAFRDSNGAPATLSAKLVPN